MNEYPRVNSNRGRLGWYLLLVAGGWIVANLLIAIVLLSSGGVGPDHASVNFSNPGTLPTLKFLQGISTVLTFLVPAYLYAYFVFGREPFDHLGFHKAAKNGFYFLAVLLLLLSMPFDGWLGELNKAIPLPGWMTHREKEADQEIIAFLKTSSTAGTLVNVFLIAVLPAICEEACFRGALQPLLIRICKSPLAGIVLTGVLFSAFHMQFEGFLPRMFLGILLGAVYWYSGSLWVSILAHFFTNAIQVVAVSYYPKFITEDPKVPLSGAMISMVFVAVILVIFHLNSGRRAGNPGQGIGKPGQDGNKTYAEEIP
jgi:membrane protease YdiL (CAAX protease family)